MTKPLTKNHQAGSRRQPVPQGPRQRPEGSLDTTKGHRDDEKRNIREQARAREFGAEHNEQKVGVKFAVIPRRA